MQLKGKRYVKVQATVEIERIVELDFDAKDYAAEIDNIGMDPDDPEDMLLTRLAMEVGALSDCFANGIDWAVRDYEAFEVDIDAEARRVAAHEEYRAAEVAKIRRWPFELAYGGDKGDY